MSVMEHAVTTIIADVHRKHGKAAALQACDDAIDGLLKHRRMLTDFMATAEYIDQLAQRDAGIIAQSQSRLWLTRWK